MGSVRANCRGCGGRVVRKDAELQTQSFSLFQLDAGGDDVCALPLSLRNVADLLHERGIDICHETVRFWWNRFGPLFAGDIRKRPVRAGNFSRWRWHADEVFVKINGKVHY